MELVHALAEQYAATITTQHNALLQQIYDKTITTHAHAHMMSSPVQGKFLEMISCLSQPKYVLEIGSFTGYSALCLAKGLQKDGILHTIELRNEDAMVAKANFKLSPYNNQIILHTGNAIDIIPTLDHYWDLVFIDADKTNYVEYYEMVVPGLKDNGVIIADNTLFHGQILENPITGKNAIAIDRFNKHVAADKRTEQVLLTIRDGLLIIKKIRT